MKLPALLTLASLLLCQQAATAAVTLTLADASTAANNVTISPGQTFSLAVTLTSTAELTAGLTYFMEALNSGSGQFTLISRDLTGSVFPDVTTGDGIAFSAASATLDPVNDHDLGGLTSSGTNGVGSFKVATLAIMSSPGIAPGSYLISTNSPEAIDGAFDPITVPSSGFTVNVVPEASSSLLVLLGTSAGLIRRRRKA